MKKIAIPLLLFAIYITACSDDSGNGTKECDLRCVANISYSCDTDGNPVQRDCGKLGCNEKTKTCNFTTVADECAANAKQCTEDGYINSCTDGHWVKSDAACPNGCQDGACLPELVCTSDEIRCHDKQLEVCINNEWTLKDECPNGCQDGACLPELVCTSDEIRCHDKQLEVCINNEWTLKDECPNGCQDGACLPELVCTNDEIRCNDKQLEVCINNAWTLKDECIYGCEDNKCKPNPCDDFKNHCEGDKLLYCDEGSVKTYDCKKDKASCKDTSAGVQCVTANDQCSAAGEILSELACDGEIVVYQSCEKIGDAFYAINHQAESVCREDKGVTHLTICTDPNNDAVFVPYDWKICASSCKATPETATEYEYAVCDGKNYGGPYDTQCPSHKVVDCNVVDKMCVSNNMYIMCLAPCNPGDPDTFLCDDRGDLPDLATHVTCLTYSDGTSGYFILNEQECKNKCTVGKGCD